MSDIPKRIIKFFILKAWVIRVYLFYNGEIEKSRRKKFIYAHRSPNLSTAFREKHEAMTLNRPPALGLQIGDSLGNNEQAIK
jgi:hypothetical protein